VCDPNEYQVVLPAENLECSSDLLGPGLMPGLFLGRFRVLDISRPMTALFSASNFQKIFCQKQSAELPV
jgi:hypothetical protein